MQPFFKTYLAVLFLSAYALAAANPPESACGPSIGTVTASNGPVTTMMPHSCYTATITQPSSNIRCRPAPTCEPLQCFVPVTESIPCQDDCCEPTPTSISYTMCQTSCTPSCPTVTVSCSKTLT